MKAVSGIGKAAKSLSLRRAWIEIAFGYDGGAGDYVALLTESVD